MANGTETSTETSTSTGTGTTSTAASPNRTGAVIGIKIFAAAMIIIGVILGYRSFVAGKEIKPWLALSAMSLLVLLGGYILFSKITVTDNPKTSA